MALLSPSPLRRSHRHRRTRLGIEELEPRLLLSASVLGFPGAVEENGANITLHQAQDLSTLATDSGVEVVGAIAEGRADVDFYQFTLSEDALVSLETLHQENSSLVSVL